MKNLFIFAHPNLSSSNINASLKESITNNLEEYNAEILDLHEEYPEFKIDVQKEQKRILSADNIIFVFPIYWYSLTPILKQYLDVVLKYGFAYGDKFSIKGKGWIALTSSGKDKEGYENLGYSIEELMIFFELSMKYMKLNKLGWINNYGAKKDNIEDSLNDLKKYLKL